MGTLGRRTVLEREENGHTFVAVALDPDDRTTRATFDAVAQDYARLLPDMSAEAPLDRAVLTAFVELLDSASGRPVVDVGCGNLPFAVAHAGALPLRSGVVCGVVAWYSLINLRPELLPAVLAEFARVSSPSAALVIAFQSGEGERIARSTAYGHPLPIASYRHCIEDVTDAVISAGFDMYATVDRQPALSHETTPQAFVLAQRRDESGWP